MNNDRRPQILTEDDAQHLGVKSHGATVTLPAKVTSGNSMDLLGLWQLLAASVGFIVAASVLVPLSLLIEARVLVPPGFAPIVTSGSSALVLGACFIGLGWADRRYSWLGSRHADRDCFHSLARGSRG